MGNVLAVWRDFSAYSRRPRALQPAGFAAPGAWGAWGAMLLLQTAGMLLIGIITGLWGDHFGIKDNEKLAQLPKQFLPFAVLLIGPLTEEPLFRGWLTGRPRALWLLGCGAAVLAMGGLVWLFPAAIGQVAINLRRAFVLLVIGVALYGWFRLRWQQGNRLTPVFAPVFWGSALVFAAAHLSNYDLRHGWPLVVMVLPQLWMGCTLGYARMRIGLWAAIGLHMANNALAFALTAAGVK